MNKSIDQLIIQMLLFDGNESNLLDDIDSYTNFRRDIHDKRSDLLRKEEHYELEL